MSINEFKKKVNEIGLKILPNYWGYLATTDDIKKIEAYLGFQCPDDYRFFMMAYNDFHLNFDGGYCFKIYWNNLQDQRLRVNAKNGVIEGWLMIHPEPPLINTGGFRQYVSNLNDYILTFKEKNEERIPNDTIPIGISSDGDLILLGIGTKNHGKIYYWIMDLEGEPGEPTYDNIGFVANSFTEFLESLYPCEESE